MEYTKGDYLSTNIKILKVKYFPDEIIDSALYEADNLVERKSDCIIVHGGTNYLISFS